MRGFESECKIKVKVSRMSLACSMEIWSDSKIVAKSTHWLEEDLRSFYFSGIRVCARSKKMRRRIGKRPCLKDSRLGWIMVVGSLANEDGMHDNGRWVRAWKEWWVAEVEDESTEEEDSQCLIFFTLINYDSFLVVRKFKFDFEIDIGDFWVVMNRIIKYLTDTSSLN